MSNHLLTEGTPSSFQLPHSRWNSLSEEELVARGYSVLTRISGLGVDTFIKKENSLFVFFQGHPEYDSDTLLREYRRDVGRYLNHEATTYPSIPAGYFDRGTEVTLAALRDMAMSCRSGELFAECLNCSRSGESQEYLAFNDRADLQKLVGVYLCAKERQSGSTMRM